MPKSEIVKRALQEIQKRGANYEYFFDRLNSPDWIEPLYREGMFQNPPPPKREKNLISFPIWPESRYLARMASLAPSLVLNVMLKIPDTDNIRVHENFTEAACAMPPDLASLWAKKEINWLNSQPYLYLLIPEKLSELVSHLLHGGQIDSALELTQSLLAILPNRKSNEPENNSQDYYVTSEPRARLDSWHYEQLLDKLVPELVVTAREKALTLLCDLLETSIKFTGPKDFSYIWRPAVEEHNQNHPHRLSTLLVKAVRNAAEAVIEKSGTTVLEIVEKRSFKIFKRIGLHLRRKWPQVDHEGTVRLASDFNTYEDVYLHHEFFLFLKERFNLLPQEAQQSYLTYISQGPNPEKWLNRYKEVRGHEPNQDEIESYIRYWQYEKLYPIQKFLNNEWVNIFNSFQKEFGELEHPDFQYYMSSWTGPTSPKPMEDLKEMSVEEIVAYLKAWQPSGERIGPSPEGLGRALSALVTSQPIRYSTEALKFIGLDPTYIRELLLGLRNAAEQKNSLVWKPVLDLCRWIINQPREIPERKSEYSDLDPGWVWTRKEIAALLDIGFKSGDQELSFNLREEAWNILRPLTDDPEPSPEYEKRYGGSNSDPATLAINTTRGEAMHAVIKYALWVRRHFEQMTNGKEMVAKGFDGLPEVRDVLEYHLNVEHDPSLAIRSVYGQWFPWLVLLDPSWAQNNLRKIFPLQDEFSSLRKTAWEAYVTFCSPYDNVFDLLKGEYINAVEQLDKVSSESKNWMNPSERLIEHLMILYWRGKLNLDDPDSVLLRLYDKAPYSLLSHAIQFIGHNLQDATKEEIALETLDRLKALWTQRINVQKKTKSKDSYIELIPFGWWFASAKFENDWAIGQLKEVLTLTRNIEPDHLVVDRLATIVSQMPLDVIECLNLIIEGDEQNWKILGWENSARKILVTAQKSLNQTAKQRAIDLIHHLGARGYLKFRDLISASNHG